MKYFIRFCEIANSDGITLGKIWVKLTMSGVKQEARHVKTLDTSCEEFVVGPAVTRQAPIAKQTSRTRKEQCDDNITDSPMNQASKVLTAAKLSARKETISLLLDRSKKLRVAMINSILDTENTIKDAEILCENTKTNKPHG